MTVPGPRHLVLGALLLALLAAPADSADFLVDDTADAVDAAPGDGACATSAGACTLRAAVQETNALVGPDRIDLPAGVYLLALPGAGEDAAATGDLDITGDLVLEGAGRDATLVDGGGLDRVFDVAVGSQVQISALTVQNGSVPGEFGGGLFNDGDLTVDDLRVRDNFAFLGGGIANFGTLHVLRSTVHDNDSVGMGSVGAGGIGSATSLVVEDTTIRDNWTGGTGGGIGSFGTVEVFGSTLHGNHAVGNGGGFATAGGTLLLTNSTVSANSTDGHGGGISHAGEVLELNNVTVTGNTADQNQDGEGDGGGIRSNLGITRLRNTIVANNTDTGGEAPDCVGGLVSEGYNLVEDPASCVIGGDPTGNVTGQDPQLGPLADHGGPTETHRPLSSSPAVDAGNPAAPGGSDPLACEPDDQRAFVRPEDGNADGTSRCDMGAIELPEPSALAMQIAGAILVFALARTRRRG